MIDFTVVKMPGPKGRSKDRPGLARVDMEELSYYMEGDPIPGEKCSTDVGCSSGKETYPTYKTALKALRMRNANGQKTKVIYRCPECGCYHLTTKDGTFHHKVRQRPYDRSKEKRFGLKKVQAAEGGKVKMNSGGFAMKRYSNERNKEQLRLKTSA